MKRIGLLSGLLAATLVGCEQDHSTRTASNTGDNSLTAMARPASAELPKAANSTIATTGSKFETVATFFGPMPTGVTVSRSGRIFVNYPKWGDRVDFTVGEIRNGQAVAYPNREINREDPAHAGKVLVSVQSVVVDPKDRLWILDTGSIQFGPTRPGGPKLVGVDLATNQVFKTILFPEDVALKTTYLNDIRFDLTRGKAGYGFITDSSNEGANGIIVVDLDTGKSWRRLNDHPSTKPEPDFKPIVEGEPLMVREPGQAPKPINFGSDGIAISADGKNLYYCPLSSRKLYVVSVDALCDPNKSDAEVAKTVQLVGTKAACDGMETDSRNRIYYGDYEHNSVLRRNPDGHIETLVQDPRILWPDTLSVAGGYLYFTANQLNRQARFHEGKDLRVKPYSILRIKIDAGPIELGR